MVHQSTFDHLRSQFDTTASMRWGVASAALGLCAWRWGASPVSSWGLKLVTGFGASLVLTLLAAAVLAVVARTLTSRAGAVAYGYFLNVLPRLLAKVQRAASAFAGVVVVAAPCWCISGSTNALAVALLGSLFCGAFAYCWVGLVVIAQDLSRTRIGF